MPTIVVPLLCDRTKPDPHGVSERVLPWARGLARQLSADVVLLTALDVPPGLLALSETTLLPQLLEDWRAECRAYLAQVAGTFTCGTVQTVVDDADPATAVARVVESSPQSLVAMASHLRLGLSRLVLGSVAMRVVSLVDCPVLVVGQRVPPPARDEVTIGRLLVALDGSPLAEQALATIETYGLAGVQLVLLRVVEDHSARTGSADGRQEAERYLVDLVPRLRERGFGVETVVQQGSAASCIAGAAAELGVDAIVLTTHGQTGLRAVLMGSTAEQVIHDATVPVLLARPRP